MSVPYEALKVSPTLEFGFSFLKYTVNIPEHAVAWVWISIMFDLFSLLLQYHHLGTALCQEDWSVCCVGAILAIQTLVADRLQGVEQDF